MQDAAPEWTVHYFDRRLNRSERSRVFASEHAALRQACDLNTEGMTVNFVSGPGGIRISPPAIQKWGKANRTPDRPQVDKN